MNSLRCTIPSPPRRRNHRRTPHWPGMILPSLTGPSRVTGHVVHTQPQRGMRGSRGLAPWNHSHTNAKETLFTELSPWGPCRGSEKAKARYVAYSENPGNLRVTPGGHPWARCPSAQFVTVAAAKAEDQSITHVPRTHNVSRADLCSALPLL